MVGDNGIETIRKELVDRLQSVSSQDSPRVVGEVPSSRIAGGYVALCLGGSRMPGFGPM